MTTLIEAPDHQASYKQRATRRRDGARQLLFRESFGSAGQEAFIYQEEGSSYTVDLWVRNKPLCGKTFSLSPFNASSEKARSKGLQIAAELMLNKANSSIKFYTNADCDAPVSERKIVQEEEYAARAYTRREQLEVFYEQKLPVDPNEEDGRIVGYDWYAVTYIESGGYYTVDLWHTEDGEDLPICGKTFPDFVFDKDKRKVRAEADKIALSFYDALSKGWPLIPSDREI